MPRPALDRRRAGAARSVRTRPQSDWRLAEFITTMRTGIDPNGRELSGQMPWRPIGRMDDEELAAVYEYLTHLPDS